MSAQVPNPFVEEVTVRDLQPGDVIVNKGREVYTVVEALPVSTVTPAADLVLRIRWADGGLDIRAWDGPLLNQTLDIIRNLNPRS